MTLTAPLRHGPDARTGRPNKLLGLEGVDDVSVELVWDPLESSMISERVNCNWA